MLSPRVSARERRTLALGFAVSVAALALAYGVVPFARRWHAREDVIAAETDRLGRLRGLVASEDRLRSAVDEGARSLASGRQRLLAGRTAALAASTLQAAIQQYADQSQVTVSRLDVAGAPDTGADLPMIPATVAAIGDIHGIVELLGLLQNGPLSLEISELTVRPNPALRGQPLQMTLVLRGAYIGS